MHVKAKSNRVNVSHVFFGIRAYVRFISSYKFETFEAQLKPCRDFVRVRSMYSDIMISD